MNKKSSKMKNLTLDEKIKIIHEIEKTSNQSAIVNRGIASSSTVSRIWKNREKILLAHASSNKNIKKVKTSKYDELDKLLITWFKQTTKDNLTVQTFLLQEKASKIGLNLGIENFTCGDGWIQRFKRRHNIVSGTKSGEASDVKLEDVEDWLLKKWPQLRKGYEDKDIFNTDETGLFYKCIPASSLRFKAEKCIGGKLSKERMTVLLTVSASGEKKKLLIIGKSLNPRCFKNQNIKMFN
jgi:hypothetical protein